MNGASQCGAYLEHLQAEHRRLNWALLAIRRQFAELTRGAQQPELLAALVKRLEDFQRELRSHFAEEEDGGCLEEAIARCPSLGSQTKDLMGEHPKLAHSLEQLLAAMKSRASGPEAWQRQFESFATDLRAHECAENRLLLTAFGGDAADYDMEGNE